MDHKRKAGGEAGQLDDRASKRRRMPAEFDLYAGESPESTTAYGLSFLEQIRRTADKSKRPVAGYFEKLLPREGNEDYYRKTRMPISLEMIEQKLNNREFRNLTELEAYFKRMVTNAKEYYNKNSSTFEDAERVRKALSNYMTKTNPAYKLIPNFSCQPTPFSGEQLAQNDSYEAPRTTVKLSRPSNGTRDEGLRRKTSRRSGVKDEEEEEEDEEEEEEEVDEEEDDDDDDSDAGPRSRLQKRPSTGSRRDSGRPQRAQADRGSYFTSRYQNASGKADSAYVDVPYKGLTFQEAQEKIVEELIRKKEDDDDWAYFEPFHNLPPRTLKEYFSVIEDPLSLKGLQKLIKGIHGRHEATGVSDFKGWAAFEEKSSLLWTNAHFFNEEGSEIYELATELKDAFEAEVAEAKAVVEEPPQPKIKLKVAERQPAAPASGVKRITIHVAGRDSSVGSPAPQSSTPASATGAATANGVSTTRPAAGSPAVAPAATAIPQRLELARTTSGGGGSPSPLTSIKPESLPRPNGVGPSPLGTPNGITGPMHSSQIFAPIPNGIPAPPPAPVIPPYDKKFRAKGKGAKDALIQNFMMRTHPALMKDNRKFKFELKPHPREAQQSVTINVPAAHWKLQIIPRTLSTLEAQGRMYRMFIVVNGSTLTRVTPIPIADDPIPNGIPFFEANLQMGVNWIAVHVIAAIPKDQREEGGPDCELEKMFIVAHLLKT